MTALWIVLGVVGYLAVGVGLSRYAAQTGHIPYVDEAALRAVFWPIWFVFRAIGRLAGGA